MIRLVAFLGNTGSEYSMNRHNVAWMLADALPLGQGLSWQDKFRALISSVDVAGERVYLLKPNTFMNNSGESVIPAMKFWKIGIDEILVVHDELELPFGTIDLKHGGGLGGHNGLRSITNHLGNQDFDRFRIGIGRPDHKDIAAYVLSDFRQAERRALDEEILPEASYALTLCLESGFTEALKKYSKFRVKTGE